MKPKQVVNTGDAVIPNVASIEQTDSLLSEMSRLYRERFQALSKKDQDALQMLTQQINDLKNKLAKL